MPDCIFSEMAVDESMFLACFLKSPDVLGELLGLVVPCESAALPSVKTLCLHTFGQKRNNM